MSLLTTFSRVLPHRLLSSIARSAAYSQDPWLKQALIDTVVREDEARQQDEPGDGADAADKDDDGQPRG